MESYLRGVVPHEMSASWPAEALKAQACAARAYAERSRNPGEAFDVYCTTRDQAYGGVRSEAAATNAAVKGTAGVVPKYDGAPIAAFYFSTSGGHTENIENVWQTSPIPYLKGVDDPYDTFSPLHLWPDNPIVHGDAWYKDKLGAYGDQNPTGVKGDLRTIYVLKRGTSPRVVKAAIIGSKGVTFVSGASLRYKLVLRDTWVTFTSMSLVAGSTTVTYGVGTTLSGRIYPALKDGATVTLRYVRDGASGSITVPTMRHTQDLGSGFTATYSTYAFTAKPKKQTTYQYVSGKARSPKITLKVRPAVAMTAEHDQRRRRRRRQVRRHVDTAPARRGRLAADEDRHRLDQRGERHVRRRRRLLVRLDRGGRRDRGTPARAGDRRLRHRLQPERRADRHRVAPPGKSATRAWQGGPGSRGADSDAGQSSPVSPRPSSSAGVSGNW